MSNSSLVNLTVKANASNYTAGRQGNKINHITVHHMAGVLTAAQCGAIFAAKGRGGSAHYGIGSDGKIALYVDEKNIAWSDANWKSNCTTVSIETSNSKTGGNWPVSDKSFKLLVKLVADIAKRNKLGKLVVGKNLFGHRDFASTVCPGPYLYGKLKELATKANEINYPPAPTTPTWKDMSAKTLAAKGKINLYDLLTGRVVASYKSGTEITLVQETTWKNVKYYRTQWSKDNKKNNGFKATDLVNPVAPAPTPAPTPTPEPTPTPTPEPEDPTVGILQKIVAFIQHIIELITKKEK